MRLSFLCCLVIELRGGRVACPSGSELLMVLGRRLCSPSHTGKAQQANQSCSSDLAVNDETRLHFRQPFTTFPLRISKIPRFRTGFKGLDSSVRFS